MSHGGNFSAAKLCENGLRYLRSFIWFLLILTWSYYLKSYWFSFTLTSKAIWYLAFSLLIPRVHPMMKPSSISWEFLTDFERLLARCDRLECKRLKISSKYIQSSTKIFSIVLACACVCLWTHLWIFLWIFCNFIFTHSLSNAPRSIHFKILFCEIHLVVRIEHYKMVLDTMKYKRHRDLTV